MEERMGPLRYLLFILIAAAFSNTVQYLMTGPNFIGFSGVLCAMLTFVWMRQRITPWGSRVPVATRHLCFHHDFCFCMLGIQLLSFFLELYSHETLPLAIANAAHLSGLLIGLFFGQSIFFCEAHMKKFNTKTFLPSLRALRLRV